MTWRLSSVVALACVLVAGRSPLGAADSIRPLRVEAAETAESQIVEDTPAELAKWVIRHSSGLRAVDVQTGAVKEVVHHAPGKHTHRGRLLTSDGRFFAFPSPDGNVLTVSATNDGAPMARLNSQELIKQTIWPAHLYLADDGRRLWCAYRDRLACIEVAPRPRLERAVQLKGRSRDLHDVFVTGDASPLVIAATSNDSGLFQVYDRQLELIASRRFAQPAGVFHAVGGQRPHLLLSFPQSATWQVIAQESKDFTLVCSGSYAGGVDKQQLMAAAISPDCKHLVTSRISKLPTIAVWTIKNGALIREIELDGGMAEFEHEADHTILRLAFSQSGKFLCAGDRRNAYLLDFDQMTAEESPGVASQR